MPNQLLRDPMIEEIRRIKETLWEESDHNFYHLLTIIRQETSKFTESVKKYDQKQAK